MKSKQSIINSTVYRLNRQLLACPIGYRDKIHHLKSLGGMRSLEPITLELFSLANKGPLRFLSEHLVNKFKKKIQNKTILPSPTRLMTPVLFLKSSVIDRIFMI